MRILMLPLVLALSACSLTPPLVKPQAPVPAVFPDAAAPEAAAGHAALSARLSAGIGAGHRMRWATQDRHRSISHSYNPGVKPTATRLLLQRPTLAAFCVKITK